mgnify:CR=1 FL=1
MRPLLRTPPTRHLLLQPARPRPAPPRPHHPRGRHVALRHPSPRALRPHDCGTPQLHVLLQTLNTCTPCLAATPRRAPTPKTAQEIPSPCAERRPRLWPAPARHTTLAQNCNALLAANATVFRLWYSLGQSLPGPRPNQPTNLKALQARAKRGLTQHRSIRSLNSQHSGQRSRPLASLTLIVSVK